MIQYPKQEHTTLPSVEMWGTSMNILKDPPKSVWTRQINKVGSTSQITEEIGGQAGDRICEYIKVYPRGINPMVSVSYSNYGTNGGQNRSVTNAGLWGNNKMCNDGRRPYSGQAKLPYPAMKDGDFRPPVFRQEDLLPLSRLPRTNTEAWTAPGFIDYAYSEQCNRDNKKPEKMRQIVQNPVRTSVRPTKIITLQKPLEEPFEIRQVIVNPIHIEAKSIINGADRSYHSNPDKVNGHLQERWEGEMYTNKSAPRKVEYSVKDVNPDNFVHDVRYKEIFSRLAAPNVRGVEEGKQKIRLVDVVYKNVSSNKTLGVTQGLEPASKGEYRMNDVRYTDYTVPKSESRALSLTPAEKGEYRMNDVRYIEVDAKKSSFKTQNVTPAEKGEYRMNDVRYIEVDAKKSSFKTQNVTPAEKGEYRMNDVRYIEVDAKRSDNRVIHGLIEGAGEKQAVLDDTIQFERNAERSLPNAMPKGDNQNIALQKTLPSHEMSSRKISTTTVTRAVDPKLRELEHSMPLASAETNAGLNIGGNPYGTDTRDKKIKDRLRVEDSFEGKATVPIVMGDMEGVADRNKTKQWLRDRVKAESKGRMNSK